MKIGTTEFTIEHFKDWSKEQFMEVYKGKLSVGIDETWDKIQTAIKVQELNPTLNGEPMLNDSDKKEIIEEIAKVQVNGENNRPSKSGKKRKS